MRTKWHPRLSSDVPPAKAGEPSHWKLRDKHRRHVAKLAAGDTGARVIAPADTDGTLFRKAVVLPEAEKNITKDGVYSSKTGAVVKKGRWRGRKIRTLTLEERATCPRQCENWSICYGNATPWARRLVHGDDLEFLLYEEIKRISEKHALVIRLHMLGDFYSLQYVEFWRAMMRRFDIAVFGYTAHPADSKIGAALAALADEMWERFSMRFSGGYQPPHVARAITVQSAEEARAADAIVCPAQIGRVANCGACGLCWHSKRTIAFLEH